jgi:hypothetical protein
MPSSIHRPLGKENDYDNMGEAASQLPRNCKATCGSTIASKRTRATTNLTVAP